MKINSQINWKFTYKLSLHHNKKIIFGSKMHKYNWNWQGNANTSSSFEWVLNQSLMQKFTSIQKIHKGYTLYITAMGWKSFCTSLSSYNSYWQDGTGYLHPLKDISWATWPLVEEWLDSMLVSTLNKYQNCIVPQIMKINMLLLLQGFSKVLFIKVLSFTGVHICIKISLKF